MKASIVHPVEWDSLEALCAALVEASFYHPNERVGQILDNALSAHDPNAVIFYASAKDLIQALKKYAAGKKGT